ncbi:hypothetical protein JL721_4316 [Aureococcus anophagefferens]|nr:hypothetical protein JL721_4316 [Aureococcus anophagefferens]
MAPKKKKGGKKRRKIDEKVAEKLQSKLKAACIDTAPAKFFKKFDKDKSGDMNAKELSKMIRVSLKISEKELSEADVKALIDALDDDGSGSLSLDELADFERKKKTLDEAEMAHFQMKLQAATFGHSPQELFKSFDKSGDGLLNAEELTHLIRVELRIPGSELSDDEIAMFIKAVDDDGTGNLSLAELGDFVEHGTKTFYQDHEHTEALEAAADAADPCADPEHAHKHHKWGERAEECEAAKEDRKARLAKKARPDFDPDEMKKLQGRRFEFHAGRLQAATYGDDPLHIFRKFDATGDGVLDVPELTKMIRLELKISGSELPDDLIVAFVRAIDDDGSMTLSIDLCANQIFNPTSISLVDLHTGIDELADFVQYGMDTFYADHEETEAKPRARVTTKQIYRPNPKPDSPHALFVDELLDDPLLRLDDCGLEPALRAFRASIVAEAPNNVATATALLKLGNLLRDVAEGREYTLNKATDAHRRALSLVATALSKEHSATLAIRFALADTLLLLKDSKGARAQYQAVLAVQSNQFPPPKTIGRTKAAKRRRRDTLTAITMSDAIATAPLAETSNAPAPGPETVVVKKVKTSTTESSPTKVEAVPAPKSEEPAAEAVEPKPMDTDAPPPKEVAMDTEAPPAEAPKPEEPKAEAPKPEEAKPEEPEAAPAAPEKAAEEPVVEKAAEPEAVKEVVTEAVKEVAKEEPPKEPAPPADVETPVEPAAEKAAEPAKEEPVKPEEPKVAEPAAAEPAAEKAAEPVKPEEPKVAEPAAAAAEPAKEEPAKEEPAKAE